MCENLKGNETLKKIKIGHVLPSNTCINSPTFDCKATSNIHDPLGISPCGQGRHRFLRREDNVICWSDLESFGLIARVS